MKRYFIPAVLVLLSVTVFAQNTGWDEQIDSAIVRAARPRPEIAVLPVRTIDLRRTASPMGEADPVKFIQTLPGVSTGMEGSSAYYVRGGNGGNNMTTIDGVPVYGSGHLLGLTTSYPSEIVSQNDFFSGGFPSDAGGFTSSLLRLTTRDGDFQNVKRSYSANNFLLGGQVSRPVKKDRLSLLASARLSPIGLEYNALRPMLSSELSLPDKIRAFAGDAFMKMTWHTVGGDMVRFSVFGSHDSYAYDRLVNSSQALGWSNLIANVTWDHGMASGWNFEGRISHNTFSAFQRQVQGMANRTRMTLTTALNEEGLYGLFSKRISDELDIQTGADAYLSFFAPGVSKVYLGKESGAKSGNPVFSARGSLHGQMNYVKGAFRACAGLRGTLFFAENFKTVLPIADLQVSYEIVPSLSVKATYDHTAQFFHSLEGLPTGWSMDMLVPSTGKNRPETADQAWAGLEYAHGGFSISVGGFYKSMKNLVIYPDASSFFGTAWQDWQNSIESGTGTAYGLEVLTRLDTKLFSGQLSYTLSKTDRVFESVNFGASIPFKFDRRHMLNFTGELKISERERCSQSITAGVSFMNGHWESVKSGSYPIYSLGSKDIRESRMTDYTSHPNNLQLPYYFRADAGYHITLTGKKASHDISLGAYNFTNRHNVYSLTWDNKEGTWKALSIFPVMPNFTYRISL